MKTLIKSKKAILGLDTVKAVILALLTLAVVTIAVMLALDSIQNANLFSGSTASENMSRNAVTSISNNISTGATNFFAQVPTFFVLLGVVVLILIIAIVIVAVSRFGGGINQGGL